MLFGPKAFQQLMLDLERANRELITSLNRDPGLWLCSRPRKWTAGQHAEHIALSLERYADALELNAAAQASGTLGPPPRRGLLQRLFVGYVLGSGRLPRGGRTPKILEPSSAPDHARVEARIAAASARHRALGERLDADAREALWIANPFRPVWHYFFPETLRVHAIHARHHAAQILEISGRKPANPDRGQS